MSTNPPVGVQLTMFAVARQAILAAVTVPVFALRAPVNQSPPYIVLRQQDDLRKLIYVNRFGGQTVLSIIAVATVAQDAWNYQDQIRAVLHQQIFTTAGRTYRFHWERSLPLEQSDYFAAVTLYNVTIL